MLNLPNALTVLRIFFVPFLVGILLAPPWALADNPLISRIDVTLRELLAVVLFLAASLTDWLDGWLARRRNQVTTLGALLDPLADKLLTGAAFIALVEMRFAPAWMVIIIIGRELAVTGLRSAAASLGVVMSASRWGKYKTGSQVVAIVLLILTKSLERWSGFENMAIAALWVVMLFAMISAVDYFMHFYRIQRSQAAVPADREAGGAKIGESPDATAGD